ncbi:predicted protein [Streptomyces viridosporus ATCC 14672]|uniref:Predicted protein n=1 Tax=Streptomyces viridosporus (strain ATCC 14672 / DSM 40746 / JCM 4963 / KCTC 9882 / NRRL B-12104 / FH 1290) TaxID=566461 RepID=D5ZQ01_STRV1|nr:predicted protein [Streptomyces viridosporus ATCC 14672]
MTVNTRQPITLPPGTDMFLFAQRGGNQRVLRNLSLNSLLENMPSDPLAHERRGEAHPARAGPTAPAPPSLPPSRLGSRVVGPTHPPCSDRVALHGTGRVRGRGGGRGSPAGRTDGRPGTSLAVVHCSVR